MLRQIAEIVRRKSLGGVLPHRLDQRLPHRPGFVRENLASTVICHPQNMGPVFKL
jgi:hypothetical protein